MSRFPQIKDPPANSPLKSLYKEIVENGLGQEHPTNWFTSQGERPDILAATWAMCKGILMEGILPPTVKQMIILKISTANDCRYCRVAHTKALEVMGIPQEVVDSMTTDLNVTQVPPLQREMLNFALKTSQDPHSVTDEDFKALRDQGLSDGEIIEIAMVAAASNFLNTWAEISGIDTGK